MNTIGSFSRDTFGSATMTRFATENGADEIYLHIHVESGLSQFEQIFEKLEEEYNRALTQFGLRDEQLIFSRLFFSDLVNQKEALSASGLFKRLQNGAVSVIEQPPLDESPIQLFAYFIASATAVDKEIVFDNDRWRNRIAYHGSNYTLAHCANYTGQGTLDAVEQTREIFKTYNHDCADMKVTLKNDTVRTWLFVRDIENHYGGMVTARRELFQQQGLNETTHYPASTGIAGSFATTDTLVTMDALAYGTMEPGQVQRMEASAHMSRTMKYGVTFERGLRVDFGDRSHLYISGTASIDREGTTLHEGDIQSQTRRTIENIAALLKEQGATLDDMAYLFVYVRDHRFAPYAIDIVKSHFSPDIPCIVLQAAICRPSWLIEMEGVALIAQKNSFPPFI